MNKEKVHMILAEGGGVGEFFLPGGSCGGSAFIRNMPIW
jgi:hypothetical protein